MCSNFAPLAFCSISIARWCGLPLPAEPYCSGAAALLAALTTSASEFQPDSVLTTKKNGTLATSDTGAKSRTGSIMPLR